MFFYDGRMEDENCSGHIRSPGFIQNACHWEQACWASHSDSPRGLAYSSGFSEGPILLSPRSDLPSKTAIYENVYQKFKTAYFQNDLSYSEIVVASLTKSYSFYNYSITIFG